MSICLENARNTEEKCPDTHCPFFLCFTTQSALSSRGWFHVCWRTNALTCVGVQTSWSQFSLSTTWVLGTEFRSSGLAAAPLHAEPPHLILKQSLWAPLCAGKQWFASEGSHRSRDSSRNGGHESNWPESQWLWAEWGQFKTHGFSCMQNRGAVFACICWLLCHNFRILQGSKQQNFRPQVGNLHTRLTPNCSRVSVVFSSLPASSLWIYAPNAPYLCCGVCAFSLFHLQGVLKLHLCYERCSLLFQSEWCSVVWVSRQHCAQSLYHLSSNRLHAHCIFLSKAQHQTFPPGQVL